MSLRLETTPHQLAVANCAQQHSIVGAKSPAFTRHKPKPYPYFSSSRRWA